MLDHSPTTDLLERKRQAIEIASACTKLLQERFAAKRVILFGSLAGQTPWHDRSDIDLAVEGLPEGQFFRAFSACRDLLSSDLDLDLVCLEDVYPEMRSRILRGIDMTKNPIAALKSLIEDEFIALQRIVRVAGEALATVPDPPDQLQLNGFASYLHQYYTGIERIFQRIAIHIDGYLPAGERSHIELLDRMAEPVPGKRNALIDRNQQNILRDYLGFRHFFRHAYGYQLRWSEMRFKIEMMESTLEQLQRAILETLDVLLQAIESREEKRESIE